MFDVLDIQPDLAAEVDFAPAADLPETRNPGLDRESASMGGRVLDDFAGDRWPRSDQRHVADEDVEELGQFVQGEFAQPFSDASDAWIVLQFESDPFPVAVLFQQLRQALFG